MAIILHYFTEFRSFGGQLHWVVEARPRLYATEMYSEESSFQQYMICGSILKDCWERVH